MAQFSGHLRLHAARREDGRTILSDQSFRAPYHLSKPYWDEDTGTLLVQVVNPTAGILEGDRLSSEIAVDADAALLVTTPSASRLFRMPGGSAECDQKFSVAAGAWLEVLPEPLVPHRGSRYRQGTSIDVAAGGGVLMVDALVPGRVGHGESWAWARVELTTEVRVAGELVLRERFDQGGLDLRAMSVLAGSGEQACFGNAVVIGAATDEWIAAIHALGGDGIWIGASRLRGSGCSIKFVTSDSIRLRGTIEQMRRILAQYLPHAACATRKL